MTADLAGATHPSLALSSAEAAFDALVQARESAIVLNHPGADEVMTAGRALLLAAQGPVRGFTAVVGYFHHYATLAPTPGRAPRDDDPAQVLLTLLHDSPPAWREDLDDARQPGVRLLAGLLCSKAATVAARLWYWLCRWRWSTPEGQARSDAHRAAFLARVAEAERAAGRFVDVCLELIHAEGFGEAPGPLQLGEGFLDTLSALDGEHPDEISRRWRGTLHTLGLSAEAPEGINLIDLGKDMARQREAIALLYGFLLLRGGEFKIAPGRSVVTQRGERTTATIATFHPKIYVIERDAADDPHTVAIVGSNNWSARALGMTWTRDHGRLGNVEVATLHALDGHAWDATPGDSPRLGEQAVQTARYIFERTGAWLGAWWQPQPIETALCVYKELAAYTPPARREPPAPEEVIDPPPMPPEPPPMSEVLATLASPLQQMLAELLGLSGGAMSLDALGRLTTAPDSRLYGGRRPSRYQLDGALRLVSMLRDDEAARRGAFLTDEAGLGKTLAAQLCVTQLITARLMQRHLNAPASPAPLHVSLIAPARLIGSERGEGTGWHGYAGEIREAVRALLDDFAQRRQEHRALDPSLPAVDRRAIRALASPETLRIRTLSASAFSREILEDPAQREQGDPDQLVLKPGTRASDPVGDLLHLATSEVVLIDESHNFRNQTSRATRALRFALSLPCPGEDWPLIWDERVAPGLAEEAGALTVRRRVLCLSATPFNNRLDDLTTQIGHFSHAQDWRVAVKRTSTQGELVPDALPVFERALVAWRAARPDALHDLDTLRPTFEALLRRVDRHLRSGRSLSVDADKMISRALDEQEVRRVSDGGPEYVWPQAYETLTQQLGVVYEWLRHRQAAARGDEQAEQRAASLDTEAHTRLDALLCNLVVQRSRARALRLVEASEGAEIDRMFRRPRVPRHPLSLNSDQRDSTSFEGRILTQLYALLGGEEEAVEGAASLDLFAYRLGIMRARQPEGGAEAQLEQTIQNNLGFQRANLVKRLQSSPYAFMRTVLRGPLRRTLYEIAIVERLVAPLRSLDARHAPARQALEAHPLYDRMMQVVARLERFTDMFGRAYDGELEALAMILDGYEAQDDSRLCAALAGLDEDDPEHPPLDTARVNQLREDVARMNVLLGLSDAHTFEPARFESSWAHLLLQDLASEDSTLIEDVHIVMGWAFSVSQDGLVYQLYDGLGRDRSLYAHPMSTLRLTFLARAEARDHRTVKRAHDWLARRLAADERLRATLGWLLIQHLLAIRDDEAASRGERRALVGGQRTLIFSEYTDTQEYVLAALAALAQITSDDNGLGVIGATLAAAGLETLRHLDAQSARVRAGTAGPHAQPERFEPPALLGLPHAEAMLQALEDPQQRDALIRSAARGLLARVARVRSGCAERLLAPQAGGMSGDSDEDALDASLEITETIGDSDVIEAFSPWYQIAPPAQPGDRADELRSRLHAAARAPVSVLLATEVLSEGVNLQECGVVLHYDLPWNPTRLIQRNGRVDRRIFDLFERPDERARLIEALDPRGELPGEWAPPLVAPQQVFHMTLLPVEPQDVELANRVRERLFEKLETIRHLFGLSYWPVVLSHETAAQVLSGELDHETPGFRRREEMFRDWSRLGELLPAVPTDDAPPRPGQLTLSLPASARARLARACGAPDDARWEHLLAAGVVFWTPWAPQPAPVRSRPEAAALTQRADATAISGALLLDEPDLDVRPRLYRTLAWNTNAQDLRPVLIAPRLDRHDPEHLKRFYRIGPAAMDTLTLAEDPGAHDVALPASPTGLAEEILTTLTTLLLDEDAAVRIISRSDAHHPDHTASLAGYTPLLGEPPWAVTLARPHDLGAQLAGAFDNKRLTIPLDPTPRQASHDLHNLWLVFG